jgi:hypothetical protein
MDHFLDKYHIPRLSQEQVNCLNSPEIEAAIKNLPANLTKKKKKKKKEPTARLILGQN